MELRSEMARTLEAARRVRELDRGGPPSPGETQWAAEARGILEQYGVPVSPEAIAGLLVGWSLVGDAARHVMDPTLQAGLVRSASVLAYVAMDWAGQTDTARSNGVRSS